MLAVDLRGLYRWYEFREVGHLQRTLRECGVDRCDQIHHAEDEVAPVRSGEPRNVEDRKKVRYAVPNVQMLSIGVTLEASKMTARILEIHPSHGSATKNAAITSRTTRPTRSRPRVDAAEVFTPTTCADPASSP